MFLIPKLIVYASKEFSLNGSVIASAQIQSIFPLNSCASALFFPSTSIFSIRDWQRHTSQFTAGKNFKGTGGFGPWLVTKDEIEEPSELEDDES